MSACRARRYCAASAPLLLLLLALLGLAEAGGRPGAVSKSEITLVSKHRGGGASAPAVRDEAGERLQSRWLGKQFHVPQDFANRDRAWGAALEHLGRTRAQQRSERSKMPDYKTLGIPMARSLIELPGGGGPKGSRGEICPASIADSRCVAPGAACGYGNVDLDGAAKVCNVTTDLNGDPLLVCEFCPPDYICSTVSRTCEVNFLPSERFCGLTSPEATCEPQRYARSGFERPFGCVNQYCDFEERRFLPGDFCGTSAECLSPLDDDWTCAAATPGAAARCSNPAANAPCSFNCPGNQYCDGFQCQDKLNFGEASIRSDRCVYGAISDGLKCVPVFSLKNGKDCSADVEAELFGCAEGLFCHNGECVGDNIARLNTPCDDFFDPCPTGYTCECNAVDATKICRPITPSAQLCESAWLDLFSCATVHNCNLGHDSAFPGTCVAKRCASQYSCVQRCIQERYQPPANRVPGCEIIETMEALCLSSILTAGPPVIPQSITSDIFITTGLFDDDNPAAALPSIW